MQYALLLYQDEATWQDWTEAQTQADMQEYVALDQTLTAEGVLRGGEALHPVESATSVRVHGGEVMVTDGPFAETREQLGGFYLIEADDLDTAIGVARRIPTARNGVVEIRPVMRID